MEEIKSVRVRLIRKGSKMSGGNFVWIGGSHFDIKVTIYKERRKRSLIGFNQNGSKVWDKIEYRDRGRYSDFSDDDLIKDFINVNSKRENSDFRIIQDPYSETPPRERSFGIDPYYLNNGSSIQIKWFFKGGGVVPVGLRNEEVAYFTDDLNKNWSDVDGNELNNKRGWIPPVNEFDTGNKAYIDKVAEVISPDFYDGENRILKLTDMGLEPSNSNVTVSGGCSTCLDDEPKLKRFSGFVKDKDIIEIIIYQWKRQVPNYDDLALCEPDNEFCELIDFINPADELEESEPVEDNKLVSEDPIGDDKIKLSFEIDSNLKIKPREDFSFKLFIGEPPEDPNLAGFDFGEDEQDLSLLDDEFIETDFQGGEEIFTDLQEVEDARRDGDNQNLETEQEPNNTPGAGTGIKSTGTYTSELPKESSKAGPKGDYPIKYGFNGVPYYGQWDRRWRDVVYGLWSGPGNEKDFVELNMEDKSKYGKNGSPSNPNIKTEWRGKMFNVKFDGQNGNNGFSSIFGGGCGVTSFSMVINYWMIKLNKGIYTSPIKMAKLACDTGARSKNPPANGTQPGSSFYSKIKEVFGLNVSYCKYDEAVRLIKSGTPVIMCGTWKGFRGDGSVKEQNGGHFVVITGYDASTKRFRVNDPGSTRSTYYFQNNLPKERNNGSSMGFWKITN